MKAVFLALMMTAGFHHACSETPSKSPVNSAAAPEKPQFDQCIGQSENEVKSREGMPEYPKLLKRGDLSDELRAPLKKVVDKRGANTVIKELCFRSANRVRVYWLVEEGANWTVISDASFAPSARF